ncbi:MAG: DUF2608 domain-containing protein [Rickettsiaceae bacterium]
MRKNNIKQMFLYLLFNFFILIANVITFNTKAEILEVTNDIGIIKDQISTLQKNDILLFDVRNVIFQSESQGLRYEHKYYYKQKIGQIEANLGKDKTKQLKSIIVKYEKPWLVDNEIPKIINDAQNSGIAVFALTKGSTGSYGVIEDRVELRTQRLKKLNIDFTKSLNLINSLHTNRINLTDNLKDHLDDQYCDEGYPVFQNGIIFTAKRSKGLILSRFLESTKLHPKKIILVDNQIYNLIDLEKKCKELGIEFVGIYFTKSYDNPILLDKKVAEQKFSTLLSENRWIDDNEATNK